MTKTCLLKFTKNTRWIKATKNCNIIKPMVITNHVVAEKLTAYLHHRITLAQLVHWAENAMLDDEFANENSDATRDVVARLGVADVRAFGLTW